MTNNLTEAITESARTVIDSPQHDLPLGSRQRIWACLGEKGAKDVMTEGKRRRYNLAKSSVLKVAPFWQKYYPLGKISEILFEADQVILGRSSGAQASRYFGEYWGFSDNLKSDGDWDQMNSHIVCYAAVQALFTAIYDERFDPVEIDPGLPNDSIDAFDFDAPLCAALVYANGGTWDKRSDPIKRREFWLWWLKDAVKAADES